MMRSEKARATWRIESIEPWRFGWNRDELGQRRSEQGLEVVSVLMVTPWQNLGRIVGFLAMAYAAWWKKSIYVSTAVHVLGNVSAMLLTLPVLLGGSAATRGSVR